MNKKEIEKNILDLEYNNNLNWRSILFGFYFVFVGAIFTFFLTSTKFSWIISVFYTIFISTIFWTILDYLFYNKIKADIETIKYQLNNLKYDGKYEKRT